MERAVAETTSLMETTMVAAIPITTMITAAITITIMVMVTTSAAIRLAHERARDRMLD